MWRNSIWDEMRRMQEEMDQITSQVWGRDPFQQMGLIESPERGVAESQHYRQPLSDIFETDKEVVAQVELPGVNKEDIHIEAKNKALEIKVEKKNEVKDEDKKKGTYRLERQYSGFYRRFTLPENADEKQIDATYKNGVLEIRIPKKETPIENSRRIPVK